MGKRGKHAARRKQFVPCRLLGRAQPVIPPNLYYNVNEHNSLGSPGNHVGYNLRHCSNNLGHILIINTNSKHSMLRDCSAQVSRHFIAYEGLF